MEATVKTNQDYQDPEMVTITATEYRELLVARNARDELTAERNQLTDKLEEVLRGAKADRDALGRSYDYQQRQREKISALALIITAIKPDDVSIDNLVRNIVSAL